MSNFNINDFSKGVKRRISIAVNKLLRGEAPSEDSINKLMEMVREEGYDVNDFTQMNSILTGIKNYRQESNVIFNVENGLVGNFTFDRRPINELVPYQSNISIMKKQVVDIINEARTIQVNKSSLENKDKLLVELKESKDVNKISRYTEKVVGDDELKALDKLISALENISLDNLSVRELPTFKSLQSLASTFNELDYIPSDMRNKFYQYWGNISSKFDLLTSFLEPQQFQIEGLESQDLPEIFSRLTLPNYVIKVSPVEVTTKSNEDLIGEVVSKFLKSVNREIPEKYKYLYTELDESKPVRRTERTYGGDDNREGDFDPTAGDEDVEERERVAERLERTSQEVQVDPLHAIIVSKGVLDGEYSDDIINTARTEIKALTEMKDLGVFLNELNELVDNKIESYLDNLSKTGIITRGEGGMFNMPILDNPEIIKLLENNSARYEVEFIRNGRKESNNYTDYRKAVEFVNTQTNKFFCELAKLLEVKTGTKTMMSRPPKPAQLSGRKGSGTSQQFLGGVTRTSIPKIAEMDVDKRLNFSDIIQVIEEYYNKPLTNPEMLFEDDKPGFYTMDCFKDFPEILESSMTMLARKAIKMDAKPIIEPIDYKNLTSLVNIIRRKEDIEYGPTLLRLFEAASESYVNLWAGVSIATKEGKKPMSDLADRVDTVLGDVLYEIAKNDLTENELAGEIFANNPITYWNKRQEEKNYQLDNPLILLESPEWKQFIDSTNVRGMKSNHIDLISTLKEGGPKLAGPITSAILQATDIIRKMTNKKIYHSNLDYTEVNDIAYAVDLIYKNYNVDIYGIDIYNILKSQSSFNDISQKFNLSEDVIYTVKGLFR